MFAAQRLSADSPRAFNDLAGLSQRATHNAFWLKLADGPSPGGPWPITIEDDQTGFLFDPDDPKTSFRVVR